MLDLNLSVVTTMTELKINSSKKSGVKSFHSEVKYLLPIKTNKGGTMLVDLEVITF